MNSSERSRNNAIWCNTTQQLLLGGLLRTRAAREAVLTPDPEHLSILSTLSTLWTLSTYRHLRCLDSKRLLRITGFVSSMQNKKSQV